MRFCLTPTEAADFDPVSVYLGLGQGLGLTPASRVLRRVSRNSQVDFASGATTRFTGRNLLSR